MESIFPHVHASNIVRTAGHTIKLISGKKLGSILLTVFPQRWRKLTLLKNSFCMFCPFHPLAAPSMCLKRVFVLEMKYSKLRLLSWKVCYESSYPVYVLVALTAFWYFSMRKDHFCNWSWIKITLECERYLLGFRTFWFLETDHLLRRTYKSPS